MTVWGVFYQRAESDVDGELLLSIHRTEAGARAAAEEDAKDNGYDSLVWGTDQPNVLSDWSWDEAAKYEVIEYTIKD